MRKEIVLNKCPIETRPVKEALGLQHPVWKFAKKRKAADFTNINKDEQKSGFCQQKVDRKKNIKDHWSIRWIYVRKQRQNTRRRENTEEESSGKSEQ